MGAQRSKRRKINEIWFQTVDEKIVIKKPKYLIKASQKLDAKKKSEKKHKREIENYVFVSRIDATEDQGVKCL